MSQSGKSGVAIAYVEDDSRFRFHFAELLSQLDMVDEVATFLTAEVFLAEVDMYNAKAAPLPWDFVFMDLGLPGIDGVEATRRLKSMFPSAKVMALTVFENPERILAAITAGADGYLLKSLPVEALRRDIDWALRFGASFSPALAEAVLAVIRTNAPRPNIAGSYVLSPRQIEVLRGLSEGESYREIAEHLKLSIDTVRSHVRQIYASLQVKSAREAVSKALRKNLI